MIAIFGLILIVTFAWAVIAPFLKILAVWEEETFQDWTELDQKNTITVSAHPAKIKAEMLTTQNNWSRIALSNLKQLKANDLHHKQKGFSTNNPWGSRKSRILYLAFNSWRNRDNKRKKVFNDFCGLRDRNNRNRLRASKFNVSSEILRNPWGGCFAGESTESMYWS